MAEQRIGKYRIVERIGRGGMGMIFKAHDPVLDRQVALKVISPEVEVTDELRTRFFREAQACARLNHPNIVTVYDMGEDEGRLFIVMELLEGQELRRLIAPGSPLTLEEKVSVMTQACAGLHFAHQKGIVHRDIKPGNIFLLPNGLVKILDFGIAHMNTTDGLTRTGLILGTLRYISPEQVSGRADFRSDMFSLGSVFYELLALRPPFLGDDPMRLLEQLRAEDPPPLSELDPGLPPALTSVVQRAMRKNPAERFQDLEEMQGEIEEVRRALNEQWRQVSIRVRGQRQRLAEVQAAAAERLGRADQDASIPGIDQRRGLRAIESLERELATRISALESELAQAEAAAPVIERAEGLIQAGRFDDAIQQLEPLVVQMPGVRRASDALARARVGADAVRLRERATELAAKALAALNERRYAQGADLIKEALELPPPADLAKDLESLRARALAEQETQRRQWQEAEDAAARTTAARVSAEAEDAPRYAAQPWQEAQALLGAAEAGLRRGAYVEAREQFERALAAYTRASETARQAREEERRTAERARETATGAQQQARMAGAEQYAIEEWKAAQAKLAEAQAAFGKQAAGGGAAAFREASGLYRQAESAARTARDRERRRAEAARGRASEGRRSAEVMDAERRATAKWQEAVSKAAVGEAAWVRKEYAKATDSFEAALELYHQAQSQIREAERRQREEATRKQQAAASGRRAAENVEAAVDAATEWTAGEESLAAGEAAAASNAWGEASGAFDRAVESYHEAEARAREVRQARREAQRALDACAAERAAAASAEAPRYAADAWNAAESAEARAVAAFSRQRYASAGALFAESQRIYGEARNAAGVAAETAEKARRAAEAAKVPAAPALDTLDATVMTPLLEAVHPVKAAVEDADATVLAAAPALDTLDTTIMTPIPIPESVHPVETSLEPVHAVPDGPPPMRVEVEPPGSLPPGPSKRRLPHIPWPWSVNVRRSAAVVGAMVLAVVVWREIPSSSRSSSPPPPPVNQAVVPPKPELVPGAPPPPTAARDDAIKAGAETFAPTRLTLAAEKEAAGAAAVKRGDMETAGQRYREARDMYALATKEATRAADARRSADQASATRQDAEVSPPPLPPPPSSASKSGKDAPRNDRTIADEAVRSVADARREAEGANAAALAPVLFARAQQKAVEGEAAIKARRYAIAQQRLAEAQDGFKRAGQEAVKRQEELLAEAKGRQVALAQEARRRDEAAALEAKRREEAALEAKKRDEAAALEAKRRADVAALEARQREDAVARDRQRAEEVRGQMLAARRQADQAGAGQYPTAAKHVSAAQAKEREGGSAFARPDYPSAARSFGEARLEYEASVQEAKRQADLVAGRQGVEQSRGRMLTRRDEAMKVDAPRLAKTAFDAAEKRGGDADSLASRQNFTEAGHRYGEAAELYLEAKMRAEAMGEVKKLADGAKARMLAEKKDAVASAPEYKEAQAEERLANGLYDRLAYAEAAEKFRATADLYARARTRTPPPAPERKRPLPPSF
jgi:serine/threonine protein kinase